MKRHFQLTLKVSADDLMILTTYLEHAFDHAYAGPAKMPRPLARRLREIAAAEPTDTAFQYLVLAAAPGWDIRDVAGDTVTITTGSAGASLSNTIELLGRLAPSCLAAAFVYLPVDPPRGSEGVALH